MQKVVFSTPFTGKTSWGDGFSGQDWYEFRAALFKEYTIKSLMNQTESSFVWWIQFRPQERNNPVTKEIEQALKDSKLNYAMTFDGPMIVEDEATWHNYDLIERAEKSMPFVRYLLDWYDHIYEVNLDSDDLIHKDFVRALMEEPFRERGAMYCKDGYIWHLPDKVAEWHNPDSNQNYTIMYPTHIYLDPERKYEYQNGLKSHEEVPKLFNAKEMPKGMYCSLTHDTNVSTIWDHPFRGKEVDKKILKDFL